MQFSKPNIKRFLLAAPNILGHISTMLITMLTLVEIHNMLRNQLDKDTKFATSLYDDHID